MHLSESEPRRLIGLCFEGATIVSQTEIGESAYDALLFFLDHVAKHTRVEVVDAADFLGLLVAHDGEVTYPERAAALYRDDAAAWRERVARAAAQLRHDAERQRLQARAAQLN